MSSRRVIRSARARLDMIEIFVRIGEENLDAADRFNYLVFYSPLEDGIHVVRIVHGSRDIPTILGEID